MLTSLDQLTDMMQKDKTIYLRVLDNLPSTRISSRELEKEDYPQLDKVELQEEHHRVNQLKPLQEEVVAEDQPDQEIHLYYSCLNKCPRSDKKIQE